MVQYSSRPNSRFLVPDLSPRDRPLLKKMVPEIIFVAESPHINEIESEDPLERRPLCGAAGRQWWSLLSELLEGEPNSDVSLDRLIRFCSNQGIVVMNAVQYPLDPKVTRLFSEADPVKNLGFSKASGPHSFKKLKTSRVVTASIEALHDRLNHATVAKLPVFPLGNDADWFVQKALGAESKRVQGKIPHPSAWWRKGGLFGRVAKEKLEQIFASRVGSLSRNPKGELRLGH